MESEIAEGKDGAGPVDETRCFESTEQPRDQLRPASIGELQHHTCNCQAEETDDNGQVQIAVQFFKAPHINRAFFHMRRFEFAAVLQGAGQPRDRV